MQNSPAVKEGEDENAQVIVYGMQPKVTKEPRSQPRVLNSIYTEPTHKQHAYDFYFLLNKITSEMGSKIRLYKFSTLSLSMA